MLISIKVTEVSEICRVNLEPDGKSWIEVL